jgi:hypothetical protein
MIGIPLGLLYANALEWASHRYLLHGLGRKKDSFWAFHWHEHHRNVRRHGGHDPDYLRSRIGLHAQGKETLALAVTCLAHVPLLPVAPFFTLAAWGYAVHSYRVHKRAHLDPAWARENVPWHVDHHLGPDQHTNWCTGAPWFDRLMGTRTPYLGTARQRADEARAARRRARSGGAEGAGGDAGEGGGEEDRHRDQEASLVGAPGGGEALAVEGAQAGEEQARERDLGLAVLDREHPAHRGDEPGDAGDGGEGGDEDGHGSTQYTA